METTRPVVWLQRDPDTHHPRAPQKLFPSPCRSQEWLLPELPQLLCSLPRHPCFPGLDFWVTLLAVRFPSFCTFL